ncbi:MAG TPA: 1-(5-phosphoribosyl)-5-((5-phosphoribosylamino)methylideneamino)imidazole-4-carboxamide isomerase [Methylophilaceae bacterium]|nr:1-(5-phosphoribosyl)-5-((5-phosphoribosylamino)methylideneamino)imidazole-4-carboxamide isomerase [Methylophilaceae bacterium]HAJ71459.1 1-(5-phosphoribosyl)-5-((5-phosphoribosylamino)methylideneamino)imidazole-4-carboxamide isomerase [Methylophilaceae bacterium]
MSGLSPQTPRPVDIRLHQASRLLEIHFDNNTECMLSCEFLRVYSPSAEVKGHGIGQEVLQIGKEAVNITAIEPVGNYAVKLVFSDGHDTGLYSWDYLYYLAEHYEALWLEYIGKLEAAGHQRKDAQHAK